MSDPNIPVVGTGVLVDGIPVMETVLDIDPAKIPPRPVESVRMLKLFKSTMSAMNFICGDGDVITFQQGKFFTDNPKHINALEVEVKARNPHIFIDPNEQEVASNMVTPMQQMRAKIIAEYIAEQEELAKGTKNLGTSEQGKLNPGSTRDIMAAASGSGPGFMKV